jgi:adenosinetriphosphatase
MAECSTTGNEGIDKFADNPGGLDDHFAPCLSELSGQLRRFGVTDLSQARIYLGATAGMRLVNLTSQEDSDGIMRSVERIFRESDFDFVRDGVKILTGQVQILFYLRFGLKVFWPVFVPDIWTK